MKYIISIILVLILFGCNSPSKEKQSESSKSDIKTPLVTKKNAENTYYQVVIDFLNSYIKNNSNTGIIEWTKASPFVTESFKKELEKIVSEAWKEDPELGLGFDPIFDAQDYPDEGFDIFKFDPKTGYVIVKGIKWDSFKLTLKVITQNGKVLVDGCGVVNIPENKRTQR